MALEDSGVTVTAGGMQWALRSGEHVCWLVHSRAEYDAGERELLARAAHAGDSVVIVGERVRARHHGRGTAGDVDLPVGRGGAAVLEVVRDQARTAGRVGRGLRILAQMEHLAPPDAQLEDLITCEMDMAELTGNGTTSVVCAYRDSAWKRELLSGVSAMHSRLVGMESGTAPFRLVRAGTDTWALQGVLSYEALQPFAAALRALLARQPRLRLDCASLELIDAAGWQALVGEVTGAAGSAVLLDRVNDTVAAAWRLSGFDDPAIPVRVCS